MTENKPKITSEREKDLADARNLLKKLSGKVNADRFKESATDGTFLKYCRIYTSHLLAVNQVAKDLELERIEERLSELERDKQQREGENDSEL